ncbi:uroporphyrinogen decarboxylase family protein [bacterium]|nr:uroporphyrinogen decarboxylase family protein [bacterium]
MTSRERVIAVIEHLKPDRIPIYAWVRANLEEQISATFGSVDAFEDRYEFDFAHLFGGPSPYAKEDLKRLRVQNGGIIEPSILLEIPLSDSDRNDTYDTLRADIDHHKSQRGRFVYVQTPGIFECLNGPFGIENHLMYLALYESDLRQVYRRQAEWNRKFAMNCLDLGVDMIHVSDDWGSQHTLMFNPKTWWNLIYPYHKFTCDAVKQRGAYLSLHSDGNVSQVLDGIVKLGYNVLHPYQESAGMDIQRYMAEYKEHFVIMGGLDVQTTIGFGNLDRLKRNIERIVRIFRDGGLLLCTSHFVQDHCSIEELTFAYDLIYELVRTQKRGK